MKRQKMKKALLRLSCLVCALMTLCTFLILPTAAAEPNLPWGKYTAAEMPLTDFQFIPVSEASYSVRMNKARLVYRGEMLNADCPIESLEFSLLHTKGVIAIYVTAVSDPFNAPTNYLQDGLCYVRYEVQDDGLYDCVQIARYENGQWNDYEIDSASFIEVYCEGNRAGGLQEIFGKERVEYVNTSSFGYLLKYAFSGFGVAIGGSAGGVKTAFNSLIYANGQSGAFSPLVIFLFSMLGLALAAGIAYKIFSMIRNRR